MRHQVNADSSPGVPWSRLGGSNKEVLDTHRQQISKVVEQRLNLLMNSDTAYVKSLGSVELVKQGYCDPVRVFIKGEMHGKDKVAQGRYRLISSVSLVDQLVERVLYSKRNNFEIRNHQTIPSKPGMGLHDEGINELWSAVANSKPFEESDTRDPDRWGIYGTDVAVFDWTCYYDMFIEGAEYYKQCQRVPENSKYARAIDNNCEIVSKQLMVNSDGLLLCPRCKGIQKSGRYTTGASNSHHRCCLAFRAGAQWMMSMGDDCAEQSDLLPHELIQVYLKMGRRLKVDRDERLYPRCLEDGDYLDFCSHKITPTVAYPNKFEKSLAKLLSSRPPNPDIGREQLKGFLFSQRHSADKAFILDLIEVSGWKRDNGVVDPEKDGKYSSPNAEFKAWLEETASDCCSSPSAETHQTASAPFEKV